MNAAIASDEGIVAPRVFVLLRMGRVSNFLVQHHWDIFKVMFPTSIGFGFAYTMTYGTSPLRDARNYLLGSGSQADVFTVRFNTTGLGGSR